MDWDFVKIVVGIVLFACLSVGAVLGIGNRMVFQADLARIEQLRGDAAKVSPITAEDVIGQVTQTNQGIVATQRYNNMWWADWAIPDGWDQVKTIPVPQVIP